MKALLCLTLINTILLLCMLLIWMYIARQLEPFVLKLSTIDLHEILNDVYDIKLSIKNILNNINNIINE